MSARVGRAVVVVLGITLAAWCVAKYEPSTFLHTDGRVYATMNRAIAEHGDLDIGRYERSITRILALDHGNSTVALGRDGRWLPKHSFLLPVLATPFYVVLGLPGLLLLDVLASLAMLALVYRFAARFTGELPAALATLALLTSPILMEQVYGYSHDVLCTLLVAGSLVALSERRWAVAGLVAGLALWAKLTVVGVLLPMSIALVVGHAQAHVERQRRGWIRYAVGFGAVTIAHAAANTHLYGAPWITSYARVIVMRRGTLSIDPISDHFGHPVLETLESLVTGARGLLPQLPLALVAIVGLLVWLPRRRTVTIGALAAIAGFIAIFCTYEWPHARYAVPWLPVIALGLAAIVARVSGTHATEVELAAPEEHRENRWILIAAGAMAALAGLSALVIAASDGPSRLSGRLGSAVADVDGATCDFFDLSSEQLTCTRTLGDRFHPAGRPGRTQCKSLEELGPLVFMSPQRRGSVTRVTWRDLPRGASPRLVLAADPRTPRAGPSVVELRTNGRTVRTFQVDRSTATRRERLPADLLARDGTTLEVEVRGSPAPVCLDVRWD